MHWPKSQSLSRPADGLLLGLLTAALYSVFTLLPNSQSLMVSWPWVFVWQVSLGLPILWLLWQLWFKPFTAFCLGQHLDWPIALLVVGLLVSSLLAEFPNQARWYAWAALGGIAALYALVGWLTTPQRSLQLLHFQGVLGLAFIVLSLGLWTFQTYLPELDRLETLRQYGVFQQFDFRVLSLRNWQPMGHQNYVAGYLVLIIPLLLGLALAGKGWQRWFWGAGCLLGLVDLYTTSSRGGVLALMGTVAIALPFILGYSRLPRRLALPLGIALIFGAVGVALANSRFREFLNALGHGQINNSELAYRLITHTIGWRMGLAHPLAGAGPGSVPLLFQKYRPAWAGREAELHFQLHSTPAQLWAELGILGIAALIGIASLLLWLTWKWARIHSAHLQVGLPPSLIWSLLIGLFAYGLMSLTDYQLDNLGLSGVLIIYLAVLSRVYRVAYPSAAKNLAVTESKVPLHRWAVGIGFGCVIVISIWLVPIHRAWAISKQGFTQLDKGDINGFVQSLQTAHQLAPWEPYYPSLLAWALGDLSMQANGGEQAKIFRQDAIEWFQQTNLISPYQEFSYSNLGWLLIQEDPTQAISAFARSAQLVPAKQGVFFGLGFALLLNNQPDLAVDAFVLELLRFPSLLTSPVWQIGQFPSIHDLVFAQLEARYTALIETNQETNLQDYWRQQRGAFYWWQENYQAAAQDWQLSPSTLERVLLQLAQGDHLTASDIPENIVEREVILAWLLPHQRRDLLTKAWFQQLNAQTSAGDSLFPSESLDALLITMNQSNNFNDWLKRHAPIIQPRYQRLGFGSLNRHIDGPNPIDFYQRLENQPVESFFRNLFAAPKFFLELDVALGTENTRLLEKISGSGYKAFE